MIIYNKSMRRLMNISYQQNYDGELFFQNELKTLFYTDIFIILITLQRITTHSNLGIYREPIKRRGLIIKTTNVDPCSCTFTNV